MWKFAFTSYFISICSQMHNSSSIVSSSFCFLDSFTLTEKTYNSKVPVGICIMPSYIASQCTIEFVKFHSTGHCIEYCKMCLVSKRFLITHICACTNYHKNYFLYNGWTFQILISNSCHFSHTCHPSTLQNFLKT